VEKKGVEYLLQCFTAIHSKLPDAELIIVGDGPLRKHLNAMAVTLDRRVHFLGELTPEKIREQMSKARILCLPSVTASNGDSEGLPTVLLEAQACGLPVVTSSCGSQNEAVLDKVTGWIFDEKDVAALARIILMLLSDDECITEAGIAARNHVENNFDITDCTRLLETRYERITAST
jgi:glycosyltransferase involved in cell wall biosynthesis